MSSIAERVFREVCLDERIKDGIFCMEEEQHMNALRDYFIKKGITREAVVSVTNRMVEGKFPERQAWRVEDGILVTWPSPQHMKKAMQANPGKYTNRDPRPKKQQEPTRKEPIKVSPPPDKDEPEEEGEEGGDKKQPSIFQGDKELAVEPPRGQEKPEDVPPPTAPTAPPTPRTPERVAAEKEVNKQIFKTDDTVLSNVANPMALNETCKKQLNELYKKADELGYREAVTFLTPYVKP